MNHPFQCIATVELSPPNSSGSSEYLLAACGPELVSTNLTTGKIVSQWTTATQSGKQPIAENKNGDEERPAKKQKTAPNPAATPPNIIKLTTSPNNHHAVIVTDHKCICVFEVQHDGSIHELSQRAMPKRPGAIQVLSDNSTILCGDKFGDVYSLPLLPETLSEYKSEEAAPNDQDSTCPPDSKPFKPSASTSTVHTQRNRKALEAQLKQKTLTPKTKEPLKFAHKLLLGHVSMLTDLCYAEREVDGKPRGYIITADRDEHIRVSRGPPQSHVIEGYCLGHKEFVSKICVVPGADLLVSGGGDDWIGVWEWPSFKLRGKLEIREQMEGLSSMMQRVQDGPLAVSGLWIAHAETSEGQEDVLVAACEKIPALAFCPISDLQELDMAGWSVQHFQYPILDVASTGPTVLVSFDVRNGASERIQPYLMCSAQLPGGESEITMKKDEEMGENLTDLQEVPSEVKSEKALEDLLYGIANLRKRPHSEGDEDVIDGTN